ncbi:MAG: hypothetical protein E4H38_04610 [Gemmatimonadales bacterium]|nr:MAG: hypothetical protein E4H38_04610 [Gemmatimonadales bacterium]
MIETPVRRRRSCLLSSLWRDHSVIRILSVIARYALSPIPAAAQVADSTLLTNQRFFASGAPGSADQLR